MTAATRSDGARERSLSGVRALSPLLPAPSGQRQEDLPPCLEVTPRDESVYLESERAMTAVYSDSVWSCAEAIGPP